MGNDPQRWIRKPVLAWFVRASVVLLPLAGAIGAGILFRAAVEPPTGFALGVLWWIAVFLVSGSVVLAAERLTRNLGSLALLFELGLLFPDRAPSRVKLALRSSSVARLRDHI